MKRIKTNFTRQNTIISLICLISVIFLTSFKKVDTVEKDTTNISMSINSNNVIGHAKEKFSKNNVKFSSLIIDSTIEFKRPVAPPYEKLKDRIRRLGILDPYSIKPFKEAISLDGSSILVKTKSVNNPSTNRAVADYTEEDLYWLSVGITMEMGCSWIPEYARNYVGCVILNRVESSLFPGKTIYDILHQPGQYPWAKNGHLEPYEWCIDTAKDLLEGNRMLPDDIIFQAEFPQGNFTYETYYDEYLKSTTYFCAKR